jgi:hypothetical protein
VPGIVIGGGGVAGGGGGAPVEALQNPSFVTPFTPDLAQGRTVMMTLTDNITVNAPTGGSTGDQFTLIFIQDATGGRRITWDAEYRGFVGQTLGSSTTLATRWCKDPDGHWRGVAVNGAAVPFRAQLNGGTALTRRGLNFVEGSGIDMTVAEDPNTERIDVTVATVETGAPADASYVVLGGHAGLSAEATLASVIGFDTAANRPAAGIAGRLFFASDTLVLSRDNGASWDDLGRLITGAAQSYTVSNEAAVRSYDANDTSLNEQADVTGTLINDLIAAGVLTA